MKRDDKYISPCDNEGEESVQKWSTLWKLHLSHYLLLNTWMVVDCYSMLQQEEENVSKARHCSLKDKQDNEHATGTNRADHEASLLNLIAFMRDILEIIMAGIRLEKFIYFLGGLKEKLCDETN